MLPVVHSISGPTVLAELALRINFGKIIGVNKKEELVKSCQLIFVFKEIETRPRLYITKKKS